MHRKSSDRTRLSIAFRGPTLRPGGSRSACPPRFLWLQSKRESLMSSRGRRCVTDDRCEYFPDARLRRVGAMDCERSSFRGHGGHIAVIYGTPARNAAGYRPCEDTAHCAEACMRDRDVADIAEKQRRERRPCSTAPGQCDTGGKGAAAETASDRLCVCGRRRCVAGAAPAIAASSGVLRCEADGSGLHAGRAVRQRQLGEIAAKGASRDSCLRHQASRRCRCDRR